MYLEACGDNAKMLEFHKQILEDDENNEAILKRQVSPCTLLHASQVVHTVEALKSVCMLRQVCWG